MYWDAQEKKWKPFGTSPVSNAYWAVLKGTDQEWLYPDMHMDKLDGKVRDMSSSCTHVCIGTACEYCLGMSDKDFK